MLSTVTRRTAMGLSKSLFHSAEATQRSTFSNVGLRYFATTTGKDMVDPVPPAKAGNDDEVPSIFDQATGLERAEIEFPDLFKHNEVLRGNFGTKENPVKIASYYEHRIVGCTGEPSPNDHDIVWLKVEKGQIAICPECGQHFELEQQ